MFCFFFFKVSFFLIGAVWTGEAAFTCLCADPGSGPSERGEHRPFEWGRRICGGLSSALGVAWCGRSAGCVLCVLWAMWAMSAAVLGRGYPVGASISSSPGNKKC